VVRDEWPRASYEEWSETCDTLHAHTQLLGKLAVALAPPEPQLQHAALRLTARGWETAPLPAPDGSGVLAVTLDLRAHEAVVEHSDGRTASAWSVPLNEDEVHARYVPDQIGTYFAAATQAALVLAAFRAPYRGRSTPVNAWWGSFDLATNLFSGLPADPPSHDFIMRNAMDSQEVAVGWWPGDTRYGKAAFYAYAHPAPADFASASLSPGVARWDAALGEYILDWDDVVSSPDPHGFAVTFARSAFQHACRVCSWDPSLAASAEGSPPPVT
jgi:hypothetical protein